MPRSYRRNYYYRRPSRRISRFNRYTRRFNRNQTATLQQRDIGRFTIKSRQVFAVTVNANNQYGYTKYPIWAILATDPQFTALNALFDQVKINGVRISATSRVQPGSTSTLLPTFVYAWDRDGSRLSTSIPTEDTYEHIASYGSSRLRPLTPGVRNSFVTSLVAQDVQERTQYIPTDKMGSVNQGGFNELDHTFFNPTFLMAVRQPSIVTDSNFNYEWEFEVAIDITFRGTRYSN